MSVTTTRRGLFRAAAMAAATVPSRGASVVAGATRVDKAMQLRQDAANAQWEAPVPAQTPNGDETAIARWAASFTKSLPNTQQGEVMPGAFESLVRALESGKPADFEAIMRGSGRRLKNPQAAFAYTLEGGDAQRFACPPAPAFSSADAANEMAEMYWLALARDVPFREYSTSPVIAQATQELKPNGRSLFRGLAPGDERGPYISQFLVRPIPANSTVLDQRFRLPTAENEYLTTFGEWLQIQGGVPPWRDFTWDSQLRYLRNGRDLAEWVHYDYFYQPFLNAALMLFNYRPEAVLNENRGVLNELNPYKYSKVQDGFATFGFAQAIDWLARVTTASLKAAWAQKWVVHRRLRPEEYGGRIHQTKFKAVEYPLHPNILNSAGLEETFRRNGTYLLPQAYPEGSPIHPSYPGGHATVAGACSIVMKALFDENALMPDCVHASADGLSLEPCPAEFVPTIGAEVNKLVSNIGMGRSWAGIHYRSDSTAGIRLGEDVAISVLQDLVRTPTEEFDGFAFTRIDGTKVKIARDGSLGGS